MPDLYPRTPISDAIKAKVVEAFRDIPPGKRFAILGIADETDARLHVAFKVGEDWKVGAAIGKPKDAKAEGSVFIVGYF